MEPKDWSCNRVYCSLGRALRAGSAAVNRSRNKAERLHQIAPDTFALNLFSVPYVHLLNLAAVQRLFRPFSDAPFLIHLP